MINESFDMTDTPGKKRKREVLSAKLFSSTPIKLSNKENFLFSDSLCMEVKSIADLVAERKASATKQIPVNEYEVIRKPPKKKKKVAEECCFVNPGLDLKADEKVINPYEVVRDDDTEAKILAKGVENPALDINNDEEQTEVANNPFEVVREDPSASVALVLPLPFTPTVNHRIDFSNMPENLTPSSLLSSKLVLENNQVKLAVTTPKRSASKARRSLSIISEEVDIGEELDNYQLQLENSINEAKMKNQKYIFDNVKKTEEQSDPGAVSNNVENKEEDNRTQQKIAFNNATYTKEMLNGLKESNVDDDDLINDDIEFEEVDSFEDVGKLGQFKRAYRTDAPAQIKRENSEQPNKKHSISGSIRRSIRKLIHPKPLQKSHDEESEKHDGIFQTIRQSLRRKQKPKQMQVSLETSIVGRQVFRETSNDEMPKKTLERHTLKRNVVKTVKTFLESVEEFDHY